MQTLRMAIGKTETEPCSEIAAEAERGQLLNQTDPHVYGRNIANTSALSSMDVFLEEQMRQDHIEYL